VISVAWLLFGNNLDSQTFDQTLIHSLTFLAAYLPILKFFVQTLIALIESIKQ